MTFAEIKPLSGDLAESYSSGYMMATMLERGYDLDNKNKFFTKNINTPAKEFVKAFIPYFRGGQ